MMETFFELPEPVGSGKTCRHCSHRVTVQTYGRLVQRCGITPCGRTSDGLKTVKVTNDACHLFIEGKPSKATRY